MQGSAAARSSEGGYRAVGSKVEEGGKITQRKPFLFKTTRKLQVAQRHCVSESVCVYVCVRFCASELVSIAPHCLRSLLPQ